MLRQILQLELQLVQDAGHDEVHEIAHRLRGMYALAVDDPAWQAGDRYRFSDVFLWESNDRAQEFLVAANHDGVLWQTGVNNNFQRPIADPKEKCPPGAPLAVFSLHNRIEVYTIDEQGTMIRHTRLTGAGPGGKARQWAGPDDVAAGFDPGAYLGSDLATDPRDARNVLQLIAAAAKG